MSRLVKQVDPADLYDVMYMVRNYAVGDDEQTRIDDPYWHHYNPKIKDLCDAGKYNEAIELIVNAQLGDLCHCEVSAGIEAFLYEFYDHASKEGQGDLFNPEDIDDMRADMFDAIRKIMPREWRTW